MKDINNNNNNNTVKAWGTMDKLEAMLSFPDEFFNSLDELESLSDDEFFNKMTGLVELCQPIAPESQLELAAAVKSGDRLRAYHTIKLHVEKYREVINEVGDNSLESEEQLEEYMGTKGYSVQEVTDLQLEDANPDF